MPFLRVRSANTDDPQHEFDVSVDQVEAEPDLYVVVDDEPSPQSRPPVYVDESAPKKSAGRKSAATGNSHGAAAGDQPGQPEKEKA